MSKNALQRWHEEALKFGQRRSSFTAINPRDNPVSWGEWRKYFISKFGRLPYIFEQVEKGNFKSWTAPIDNPASMGELAL